MNTKYKVGDKVIPISKSKGTAFHNDSRWKYAQANDQPFLYVVLIEPSYSTEFPYFYHLSNNKITGGNHYLEKDLLPYEFDEQTLFEKLINGNITEKMYSTLLHRT